MTLSPKTHACMKAAGATDVCAGCPSYITIAKFGIVDVNQTKHQKVSEVTATALEIVHVKYECYSYPLAHGRKK